MSIRSFAALLLAIYLAVSAAPAHAATATKPEAAPATVSSTADLQHMVDALQDEQQRQRLIKDLQALIAAQQKGQPAAEQAPATPSDFVSRMMAKLQQLGDDLVGTASVVVDAPYVIAWTETQLGDPALRGRWLGVFRHVAVILGAAIITGLIVWAIARRLRVTLVRPAGPRWSRRLLILFCQLLLDAAPIAAFTVVGEVMLGFVPPNYQITANVAATLIQTIFIARMFLVLARAILLDPREASWTLLRLSEESANYLYIWARRFVFWVIYGLGISQVLWYCGIPGAVYGVLLKAVALVQAVLAIVFVLQNRHAVAQWLRPRPYQMPLAGAGAEDGADAIMAEPESLPPRRSRALDMVRHRIADVWHVLVIVYIVGLFSVYALKIDGGFSFVFRSTLLTVAILIVARLLIRGVDHLARRGFAIGGDLKRRFPTLETRANRYLPMLTMIASIVVWAFAILSLLEVWGVGSYAWLGTTVGKRVAGSLFTIVAIVGFAFVMWEIVNAAIDRYLTGMDGAGNQIARSARVRTLLPLIRNVMWVTLLLVVLLLILSEIGVNIAPLLGVSAVFGLAIGFGSQALVKDIITGLFILIEDIMAVGDVVDLSGGYSGVVEAISVRTIKLRDAQGTLQTIPFSEVTKVKNLSRDFAYFVIDLALPLTLDPDQVGAVLTEVASGMAKEPAFASSIVAPIELLGVTSYGLTGMQYQARLKTRPLQQWGVGREFNKRIKAAFEAAKIGMPAAVQTVNFTSDVMALAEKLGVPAPQPDGEAGTPQPAT
ncbi:MAG TPA: mechanosensitive ion channel domain-containing protein [Aliidongia sp.]|nr:mechanosensitive ion channel domain-containing protein [Aliidongia sp.]